MPRQRHDSKLGSLLSIAARTSEIGVIYNVATPPPVVARVAAIW
jgi:hypothetical protein